MILAFRKRILCAIVTLVACVGTTTLAEEAQSKPTRETKPVPAIERAILVSIDGCRPDVMLRADMPNVRRLLKEGSYSFWATTVPVAITLPSHTSMITGVLPEKHGITWNGQVSEDAEVSRPLVPTLFDVAIRYGMTTAVVAGKSKFDTYTRDGHIGKSWTKSATDEKVGDKAVEMLKDYRPEVMLIHFPGADKVGHAIGFSTPQQIEALEGIDKQIGRIIDTVEDLGLTGSTAILVTSDHGGQGRGHGAASGGQAASDDPRSLHIPWILVGPGIRKGYDLTQDPRLHIRTMDTFSTLCFLLGIKPEGELDGKPITLAIEQPQQLLQESK